MAAAAQPNWLHRYRLVVQNDDLDDLGHVNNARYLDYLERGRTTWYDELDLFEQTRLSAGVGRVGTVVVNLNIDFRDECLLGDALFVDSKPSRVGTKSFTLEQRIVKADSGRLSAEARVTSVVMDLDQRSALALPTAARAHFE